MHPGHMPRNSQRDAPTETNIETALRLLAPIVKRGPYGDYWQYIEQVVRHNEMMQGYIDHYTAELSALRAENARLREALRPFTHPDLLKATGGTIQGDDSPVYGRDKATLKLGDFRRAHRALTETEAS